MAALRPSELSKKIVRNFIGLANTDPLPHLPNRSSMIVMLWNCRRADNKIFRRNFRELIRVHHPNVVALFETKVPFSSMGLFFNHLGFIASTIVDPVGLVGGIWLIWDPTQVSVSAHIANSQVIQAIMKRENHEEWVLAAVYASPNPGMRQNLWNDLEDFSNSMTNPWLIAGDFNDVMGQNKRRSFTKNNQRTGNTMERLDRALCNAEWRITFPEGAVRNLPRTYLDHSPLMVYTEGQRINLQKSKMFISPNVNRNLAKKLSQQCGISLTQDLGKYLGVPLIHSRVSRNIYNGVIEKIQKKLSSWKAKALSLADSEQVVLHINNTTPNNYPHRALIEDIKFLMLRCNCAVFHILREGNNCADGLANMGVSHVENLVVLDNPPNKIANLLIADIVGASYERA
ncbi:hypothetical protein ACSBR1_026069 [Camellia fascicularis]